MTHDVIDAIPREFVIRRRIVPLERDEDRLIVGHDAETTARDLLEAATLLGRRLMGKELSRAEIDELLYHRYGLGGRSMGDGDQADAGEPEHRRRTQVVAQDPNDSAAVGFVADLLHRAIEERATDIHLEPFEEVLKIRFRIDGFLRPAEGASRLLHVYPSIVSRLKVMADLDIAEHRLPQDGRIKAVVDGQSLDIRISVLPSQFGESVNLRLLTNAEAFSKMEALGLWPDEIHAIESMLDQPHGVVLVSGPTGSGKTTSLYAFLHHLNDPTRKILTIEDPTEYNLPGVTQIEIRPQIGLTFANGLRSMLRHDPDIMMVGEIRDQDTAETVIRVALTGHLVLSTVHTNDAPSTPARLLDMAVAPFLLSSCLRGIIAQRLVRLICPKCKEADTRTYTPGILGIEKDAFKSLSGDFAQGRGCDSCSGTGYRGRTAIYEIVRSTPTIHELIESQAPTQAMARAAARGGYVPMRVRGLASAARGITTVEEVLRVTPSTDGEAP